MLTTPPGRSLVASTSAKVTARSGLLVRGEGDAVLPPTMVGADGGDQADQAGFFRARGWRRRRSARAGEKLKWELLTGFTLEKICWYLSAQPA